MRLVCLTVDLSRLCSVRCQEPRALARYYTHLTVISMMCFLWSSCTETFRRTDSSVFTATQAWSPGAAYPREVANAIIIAAQGCILAGVGRENAACLKTG